MKFSDAEFLRVTLLIAAGLMSCGEKEPDSAAPSDPQATSDPWSCEAPVDILQADGKTPSGFVQCADGVMDRAAAVTCTTPMQGDSPQCLDPDNVINHRCSTAADCTDAAYGQCIISGEDCGCVYGCETDADCSSDEVCVCAGVTAYSQCRPATCQTSDECGDHACAWDDYLCSSDTSPGQLACHTDDDECTLSEECEVDANYSCNSEPGSGWTCESTEYCGDGRPFLVDGAHRVAPSVRRLDWGADVQPAVAHLDKRTREALAAAWLKAGQDEHASVAAFSRFSLQLLSLGAPPELLLETHQAAHDEIEHARLCFAMASAYSGRPIGPGPLPMDGALTDADDIIGLAIAEACIGETMAASTAAVARDAAEDPVVAQVLTRIAEDELRHAALGWRFLAWWLRQTDAAGQAHAAMLLTKALDRPLLGAQSAGLQHHGRLDTDTAAAVHATVLASVLVPVAAALLQQHKLAA